METSQNFTVEVDFTQFRAFCKGYLSAYKQQFPEGNPDLKEYDLMNQVFDAAIAAECYPIARK